MDIASRGISPDSHAAHQDFERSGFDRIESILIHLVQISEVPSSSMTGRQDFGVSFAPGCRMGRHINFWHHTAFASTIRHANSNINNSHRSHRMPCDAAYCIRLVTSPSLYCFVGSNAPCKHITASVQSLHTSLKYTLTSDLLG
jgi:hypothetical protein